MDLIERAAANLAKARRVPAEEPGTSPAEARLIGQTQSELAKPRDAAVFIPAEVAPPLRAAPRTGTGPDPVVPLAEPAPEKHGTQIEKRTSKSATIDFGRLRSVGMVTPFGARSRIDEEFRIIKRPLLLRAFAKGPEAVKNGHLIMITSARPGEGKTFTAVSLAMSIASEPDLNVLLVDADVVRPKVPSVLGLSADRGLVDLIADETLDMADVLIRTNAENLTVLPAGRPHHLATELLASERMARIVEEMAERYRDRVIIFDSPPTLASSVPGVLALHAGQAVFVIEAERTSESAINAGLSMISACKHVGLVLNRIRPSGMREELYSYYYAYDRP